MVNTDYTQNNGFCPSLSRHPEDGKRLVLPPTFDTDFSALVVANAPDRVEVEIPGKDVPGIWDPTKLYPSPEDFPWPSNIYHRGTPPEGFHETYHGVGNHNPVWVMENQQAQVGQLANLRERELLLYLGNTAEVIQRAAMPHSVAFQLYHDYNNGEYPTKSGPKISSGFNPTLIARVMDSNDGVWPEGWKVDAAGWVGIEPKAIDEIPGFKRHPKLTQWSSVAYNGERNEWCIYELSIAELDRGQTVNMCLAVSEQTVRLVTEGIIYNATRGMTVQNKISYEGHS